MPPGQEAGRLDSRMVDRWKMLRSRPLPPILPSGACSCRRAGSLSWLCLVSWSPRSGHGLSSWTKLLLMDARVARLIALNRRSGPGSRWKNYTAISMIAEPLAWRRFSWLPCASGKSRLRRVRALRLHFRCVSTRLWMWLWREKATSWNRA
ncbi:hypothetical protein D9M70_567600 [compost metagenome]